MTEPAPRLQADCTRCRGLCCIVFAHETGNGFPAPKPANRACRHLDAAHRCRIFANLEREDYVVCRAYDCHGAGPLVSRWIEADGAGPGIGCTQAATQRLEDFRQLSRLHMLLAACAADDAPDARSLHAALDAVSLTYERTGRFAIGEDAANALRANDAFVAALLHRLAESGKPARGKRDRSMAE